MFQGLGTQLLMYGVQAVVAVVCIASIVRAIFIPTDIRRSPACGGCGYPITSEAPTRCPECGGQLTKVGISTPSMTVRFRGSLSAALLAWTVICGMMAQIGWGYVQQAAWAAVNTMAMATAPSSKTQHSSKTSFMPQRNFSRNTSTPDLSFRIDMDSTYVEDASVVESGTATLSLRENGTKEVSVLELDIAADTFTITDTKGAKVLEGKSAEFNEAAATKWFEAAGLGVTTPADTTSRADVLKLVKAFFIDPQGIDTLFMMGGISTPGALHANGRSSSTSPVGGGFRGFPGPMTPNYWTLHAKIIVGVISVTYLTGFVFIWRRRRRMLA